MTAPMALPGRTPIIVFFLAAAFPGGLTPADALPRLPAAGGSWPAWRGPLGTGEAPGADPPVTWSEKKNVRWKSALPGAGHSTPIVWGERVFVTASEPYGEAVGPIHDTAPGAHDGIPVTHRRRWLVLALKRKDGSVDWQKTVCEALPHEGGHQTGSYASASPVTDGERLYANFGSRGLYCFTLEGVPVWDAHLGTMHTKHAHGEGSSPALHGDLLVLNWDHEDGSFLIALDKRTGKERWKVARAEDTSWATPVVVEHHGKPQVIVSGTDRLRGYDLATGEAVWECGGLSENVVASPVAADGMVFAGSSYDKQSLIAVRLEGARGDITGTDRVAWVKTQRTPYVPSPLYYGGSLYYLRHYQNILNRVEARTGDERWGPFRLTGIGNVYASPVAAADRVYVADLEGATAVLSHGDKPEVLAVNKLAEGFSASPAIAGGELYLRGEHHLYCIAGD
jgi:outer membrane protein assembly factor BamB